MKKSKFPRPKQLPICYKFKKTNYKGRNPLKMEDVYINAKYRKSAVFAYVYYTGCIYYSDNGDTSLLK